MAGIFCDIYQLICYSIFIQIRKLKSIERKFSLILLVYSFMIGWSENKTREHYPQRGLLNGELKKSRLKFNLGYDNSAPLTL